MSRYTHQGYCGFQPRAGADWFYDRIEQQNEMEERDQWNQQHSTRFREATNGEPQDSGTLGQAASPTC